MAGEVTRGFLDRLYAKRTEVKQAAESIVHEARSLHERDWLSEGESFRLRAGRADLDELDARIHETRSELQRAGHCRRSWPTWAPSKRSKRRDLS